MGDHHGYYQSSGNKSDGAMLTSGQLTDILKVLDDTRHVLDKYIVSLEEKTSGLPVTRQPKWSARYCCPGSRNILYRHVTMVTIGLQFLNLMIVSVIDMWPGQTEFEDDFLIPSACVMGLLQVLNLIPVIMASVHLARRISRHATDLSLIMSTYAATTLLFAGVYTLTYRVQSSSWELEDRFLGGSRDQVFIVYNRFLLTSISTATLCGSENFKAVTWYNGIFLAVQMLLSFCYFASVLGATLTPTISRALNHLQTARSAELRPRDEVGANNNNCLPYHVGCCCQTVQENIQLRASYHAHRRRSAPDFTGKGKQLGYRPIDDNVFVENEQDASSHC